VYPVLAGTSKRRRRGLRRTSVFFPYFAMDVSYGNANARRDLEPDGIEVPPIDSYFGRLVEYAQRAQWGRAPVSRAQAAADCFDSDHGEAGSKAAVAAGPAVH
jgi:hypothetical protein